MLGSFNGGHQNKFKTTKHLSIKASGSSIIIGMKDKITGSNANQCVHSCWSAFEENIEAFYSTSTLVFHQISAVGRRISRQPVTSLPVVEECSSDTVKSDDPLWHTIPKYISIRKYHPVERKRKNMPAVPLRSHPSEEICACLCQRGMGGSKILVITLCL